MKKTILGLFLGMSVMGMAAGDNTDSGDLTIKANLIAPITIKQDKAMDFGDVTVGRETTATATGTMLVSGISGNNIIVTVPKSATIKGDSKGATIEIDLSKTSSGSIETLNENGEFTQTVSGKFEPKEVKYAGQYTGTVSISVKYN